MLEFRPLKANEIECKVSMVRESGIQLLLYKTARTDMQLLDETVGAENWDRDHKELKGNSYIDKYYNRMIKWDVVYDEDDDSDEIL